MALSTTTSPYHPPHVLINHHISLSATTSPYQPSCLLISHHISLSATTSSYKPLHLLISHHVSYQPPHFLLATTSPYQPPHLLISHHVSLSATMPTAVMSITSQPLAANHPCWPLHVEHLGYTVGRQPLVHILLPMKPQHPTSDTQKTQANPLCAGRYKSKSSGHLRLSRSPAVLVVTPLSP